MIEVPPSWLDDASVYRTAVTGAAEYALALPASGEAVYVPKARDELELLIALWPHVVAVPTSADLSIDDLILARAWPVHPLGVTESSVWADGRWCSPAEMFFHDVDHARFKVREDVLARGVELPDPYQDGSTFDATAGRHRTVLDLAAPHVDGEGWSRGPERERRAAAWLAAMDDEPRRDVAEAARWLLFELVHEKGLPLEPKVLGGALATSAHVDKLRAKCGRGFFADHGPSPAAVASLDAAVERLRSEIARPVP